MKIFSKVGIVALAIVMSAAMLPLAASAWDNDDGTAWGALIDQDSPRSYAGGAANDGWGALIDQDKPRNYTGDAPKDGWGALIDQDSPRQYAGPAANDGWGALIPR